MEFLEMLVLVASIFAAIFIYKNWYAKVFGSWTAGRGALHKTAIGLLPLAALGVIILTLRTLASFDVVDDSFYIFFYALMGLAWVGCAALAMGVLLDVSWADDVVDMNNRAAFFTFVGGYLGSAVIFAGANIGDGPGWWCVVFAGGLGGAAFFALAIIVNKLTGAFERVTIGRDAACGIRMGCFLLAAGIIFGRASAGDWTSAAMTVKEFAVGWPALPLALLAAAVEKWSAGRGGDRGGADEGQELASAIGSAVYGLINIAASIAAAIYVPPLMGNYL